jgi:hypothetical protein
MRTLALYPAAAFLLALSASGYAQTFSPPSVEFHRDKDGTITYERIRNTTLRTLPYGDDDAMLLVVEQDQRMKGDEVRDSVQVRALGWDGRAFTRPLWARSEAADAWEIRPADYLRLTTIACCGTTTTHTLYDLDTGKEVAWHTAEPLMALDLRGRPLLVLYESPYSVRAPATARRNDVQGMLRIVRDTELTDQVLVTGRYARADEEGPELHAAFCDAEGHPTLQQESSAENDDVTFNACFQLQGGDWIFLPVRGGQFVLESARLPTGIAVRRGGW